MALAPCKTLFLFISSHSLQDWSDVSMTEKRPLVKSIRDAEVALDFYFYVVSALCCVLLFFATWISIEYQCAVEFQPIEHALKKHHTRLVFSRHWEELEGKSIS